MAYKPCIASSAYSTAATWGSLSNTPTLHATTNITVTAGGVFSATFTAPSITDSAIGVWVFVAAVGTAGTLVATLQENSVDTTATASKTITSLTAANWYYFVFGTPYTFTSIAAGYYRIKLNTSGASGTTSAAANSGATNFAYMAVDNRTGVPASTDNLWIGGFTVTMDGTQTCGAGTDTVLAIKRTLGNSINIYDNGILSWDTAASATLTNLGNVVVGTTGELRMGTVASPYPTGQIATLTFNENGTDGNHGMIIFIGGKMTLQGEPKTSTSLWKTKLSSGVGTAASPLVTADAVDWAVNDEILIGATSDNATNYNETEQKFIITKNSSTSYVLSDTLGGAEAAFTYTHSTDAWVLNITRNVIINTSNSAQGWYYQNLSITAGNVNCDWFTFQYGSASSTTGKTGLYLIGRNTAGITGNYDYGVSRNALAAGFNIDTSVSTITWTGLISCLGVSASNVGAFRWTSGTPSNKTFVDCFAIKNTRGGWQLLTGGANYTFTRCYAISCNTAAAFNAGIDLTSIISSTFTDCEVHACGVRGLFLQGTTAITFSNFLSGTKGNNTIDIDITSNTYNDVVFTSSTLSSTTFINNYLNLITGSKIAFDALSGTANNHIWYTNYGIARSTGSGLVDTTVRTTGSLGLRIAAEEATTGFTWEFNIPQNASSIINFFGYFQKNTAFATSVCTVELWLYGSTSADATANLTDTTGSWQSVSLSVNNTQTVDRLATIKVIAKTTTAAAYIYIDDLFNAGDGTTNSDKVTGLDTWDKGKPISIIQPSAVSAADIWTFSTTALTTADTTGNHLVRIKQITDDNQALILAK